MLQLTARGKESEILNELSKIPSSTAKMVNMYKNRTTLLIIMYIQPSQQGIWRVISRVGVPVFPLAEGSENTAYE